MIYILLFIIIALLAIIAFKQPPQLDVIERINQLETKMAGALDRLETEVAETTTVIDSAIVLLKGLKDALDAAIASGNMSRVSAVADTLDAQTNALAAAVVANTPTSPPPPTP